EQFPLGALVLREEHIAVFEFALQYRRQASAADALFAGGHDRNPGFFQYLDHGLVLGYVENLAGAGDLDLEAFAAGVGLGGEVFAMNTVLVPAPPAGAVDDVVHETGGAADVQMA